ncbi:MAG: radical SAM protein [Holophaga sp.]|nr:radical SAM protein [Holophaga sp.]
MRYALPFLGRKAVLPPLGLLTVAAMLPPSWNLKLLDLNVESISRKDVDAADLVLVSAMLVQRAGFERLVALCLEAGKPVLAGGPYPTSCHDSIEGVDWFVLGEAEVNLPPFLKDFELGTPKHCYRDPAHPDLSGTPAPRYDLVRQRRYAGAALQFSRGCPHHCEFCDIVELFGHRPRTKRPDQFLAELDLLFDQGWRGSLFVVDDNFIGNRKEVRELLPELARWQEQHHRPFSLFTEASLDLAADPPLMEAMVAAGFNMVFVGIETPDQATLEAVEKSQNSHADLLASVRAIQDSGLEVSAGFILGFDEDRADIFDRQIHFIEKSAIPTAMVGLLTALPRTRLHARLGAEGRLLGSGAGGNNTHDLDLNFRPRMDAALLRDGYKRVLQSVYTPRRYFDRCLQLVRRMKHGQASCRRIRFMELRAFILSLVRQTCSRYGLAYWSYLFKGILSRPLMTAEIVALAVKGHHFFTITDNLLSLERFRERLEGFQRDLEARLKDMRDSPGRRLRLEAYRNRLLKRAWSRCRRIHPDFQDSAFRILEGFRTRSARLLAQGLS